MLKLDNLLCENLEGKCLKVEAKDWISFDLIALLSCVLSYGLFEKLYLKYKTVVEDKSVISQQHIDLKYIMREKIQLKHLKDFAD